MREPWHLKLGDARMLLSYVVTADLGYDSSKAQIAALLAENANLKEQLGQSHE